MSYSNIREILGPVIGQRLIDITQHDEDEYQETRQAFIMLHFEDGSYLKFPVEEKGVDHNIGEDDPDEECQQSSD